MATTTSSNSINTTAAHEATLDRSQIGSPADGRKLNSTGTQGSGVTSGMAASQNSEVRPVAVKQVDHKTIEGSNPGDSRAQGAPAVLPNNPAPRTAVGQAPFGKNTPSGLPQVSVLGADSTDQN